VTSPNIRERWVRNGWNVSADDDTPKPPEVDPLSSGQRKRYLATLQKQEPIK
jgi:hypothetical protein